MECREFNSLIPIFLENKINKKQAAAFFEHMDLCEECKEELRIQFLVTEGMARLEDGQSFDLKTELDARIEATKRAIKSRTITNIVIYSLEVVGILAVIFILFLVFTRG